MSKWFPLIFWKFINHSKQCESMVRKRGGICVVRHFLFAIALLFIFISYLFVMPASVFQVNHRKELYLCNINNYLIYKHLEDLIFFIMCVKVILKNKTMLLLSSGSRYKFILCILTG